MERISLRANGLNFQCLSHGEGHKIAVLLHGLFDDAGSMQPLMALLARDGFRSLAPYMRGYGGTGPVPEGKCRISDMAWDVVCLARESRLEKPLLIGHDLGALAAYAAANMAPGTFSRMVLIGMPPLRVLLKNLPRHPGQLRRSWYMFYFQFPFVAQWALPNNGFGVIERLWRDWSPNWRPPPGRIESVKETLRSPGAVEATATCCRGLLRLSSLRQRTLREGRRLLMRKNGLPGLIIAGKDDGCFGLGIFDGLERTGPELLRLEVIEDSGHFMHLERTERVGRLILDFMGCEPGLEGGSADYRSYGIAESIGT